MHEFTGPMEAGNDSGEIATRDASRLSPRTAMESPWNPGKTGEDAVTGETDDLCGIVGRCEPGPGVLVSQGVTACEAIILPCD
jgi:hypothetical protein